MNLWLTITMVQKHFFLSSQLPQCNYSLFPSSQLPQYTFKCRFKAEARQLEQLYKKEMVLHP